MKKRLIKLCLCLLLLTLIIYLASIFIGSVKTIDFAEIKYPHDVEQINDATIYEEDSLLYKIEIRRLDNQVLSTVRIKPLDDFVYYTQRYFIASDLSNKELMVDLGWAFRNETLRQMLNPINWIYNYY